MRISDDICELNEIGPTSRKNTLSRIGTSISNFDEPKENKSKVSSKGTLTKIGSEQTTTPAASKPAISLKGKSILQKIIEKKTKGSLEEVEEDDDKSSEEAKSKDKSKSGEEDDEDDDDDSGENGSPENDIGSPELEQWMAEYKISEEYFDDFY